MGELRQEFLRQIISNLQTLQHESFENAVFSEEFLRRFFRQLHTIKGTSRTFDLENLSHLAHEIENLLQAIQNNQLAQNKQTTLIFQNGFTHLLKLAQDYQKDIEPVYPQEFAESLRKLLPPQADNAQDLLYRQIPNKFISLLSAPEKANLNRALQNNKTFYLLGIVFNLLTFYEDFKQFKQILSEHGEVIAVAPADSQNLTAEISFQVFFTANLPRVELEKIISNFSFSILFENSPIAKNFANNLGGLLANLVTDGEKTAQILSKKIAFETSFSGAEVSDKTLILLHEIASHLIHNAIDHGIESVEERTQNGKKPTAKIEINLAKTENNLLLQIKDDGKGIDIEKITHRAKEKDLISQNQNLDEKQAVELIFTQGFSTSLHITEISGRGVGLDAVKDLVESSGGKIEVESKLGKGTTFSVYLLKN